MLLRLPRILIALALAFSVGLHWSVLQVVAWAGMMITYSQDAPLAEAMVKTFDGNHPCKLCKQIAKETRSEKKSEYKIESSKTKFANALTSRLYCAPTVLWEFRALDDSADLLTDPPAVPPPRALPA